MGKTLLKMLTFVDTFLRVLPLEGKQTEERQNEAGLGAAGLGQTRSRLLESDTVF